MVAEKWHRGHAPSRDAHTSVLVPGRYPKDGTPTGLLDGMVPFRRDPRAQDNKSSFMSAAGWVMAAAQGRQADTEEQQSNTVTALFTIAAACDPPLTLQLCSSPPSPPCTLSVPGLG